MPTDVSNLNFPSLDLLCLRCGYDLRGTDSPRCPECGTPVDRAAPVTIPWAARRTLGTAPAFARTVGLATFRPRTLGVTVAVPVSLADAVAFRRVVAAVAAVSIIAVTAPYQPPTRWPVHWLGIWLACHAAAGTCTVWFHPRSIAVARQNRAVGVAHYACGPLALVPVPAALAAAAAMLGGRSPMVVTTATNTSVGDLLVAATIVAGLLIAIVWVRAAVVLLGVSTGCGVARKASLAVGLPVVAAAVAVLFAAGLPAAYDWLTIVVRSLR